MTLSATRRFLAAPASERRLLVEAALQVALARMALWIVPFATARRWFSRRHRRHLTHHDTEGTAHEVARAVRRASRLVPSASCLTQALATRTLLARRGLDGTLRFGVAKSPAGDLEAHAWIECEGRIVIGGDIDLGRFVPLPASDEDAAHDTTRP